MALSNWDTLTIDLDGNAIDGVFTSPKSRVQVEIYKNWIHIQDPKGWHGGGSFASYVVAQIQHGSLVYHDVNIEAIRGPQNGIYIVCWTVEWIKIPPSVQTRMNFPKEEGKTEPNYHGMIGCGVYGFEGGEWVGVKKESLEFLKNWVSKKEPIWDEEDLEWTVESFKEAIQDRSKMPESDIRDMTPEQYKEYLKSKTQYVFEERIATVDFSKAVRFCQGDEYFEGKLGVDKNATAVGQAEEPIFLKMLGKEEEK